MVPLLTLTAAGLLCRFIVLDIERFRQATILRYSGTVRRMLGDES
ncbi:MAG TPA: hypothetical protein VF321_06090 [Gaiellaceae bacterium]